LERPEKQLSHNTASSEIRERRVRAFVHNVVGPRASFAAFKGGILPERKDRGHS
jgi:hypothetical protein